MQHSTGFGLQPCTNQTVLSLSISSLYFPALYYVLHVNECWCIQDLNFGFGSEAAERAVLCRHHQPEPCSPYTSHAPMVLHCYSSDLLPIFCVKNRTLNVTVESGY